jgi:hypothetical protein
MKLVFCNLISYLNETCVYKTQVSFKFISPLFIRTREAILILYLNETCVYKTQVSFKFSRTLHTCER